MFPMWPMRTNPMYTRYMLTLTWRAISTHFPASLLYAFAIIYSPFSASYISLPRYTAPPCTYQAAFRNWEIGPTQRMVSRLENMGLLIHEIVSVSFLCSLTQFLRNVYRSSSWFGVCLYFSSFYTRDNRPTYPILLPPHLPAREKLNLWMANRPPVASGFLAMRPFCRIVVASAPKKTAWNQAQNQRRELDKL